MTAVYDRLQSQPQTNIDRGSLAPDERRSLRELSVDGLTRSGSPVGSFTAVYYLEGDLGPATRAFANVNDTALERVSFDRNNVISKNFSQDAYDLLLHHVGERVRELYSTVVREDRPSGVTWILDREHYMVNPRKRYSIGSGSVAKIPADVSLEEVFASVGSPVTGQDLASEGVKGSAVQVLDYYRVAGQFACSPSTEGGELAVVKA